MPGYAIAIWVSVILLGNTYIIVVDFLSLFCYDFFPHKNKKTTEKQTNVIKKVHIHTLSHWWFRWAKPRKRENDDIGKCMAKGLCNDGMWHIHLSRQNNNNENTRINV